MRPPSKHGLERKFKPWRKGKSIKKSADGTLKRPTNASLRNQLRGQKRLLAKLQQKNGPGDGNNPAGILDIKERISQLERDIEAYETREREKKNASKYHQVKFIERQKLTRLEKSVSRQLNELQGESNIVEQTAALQRKLQSIAMDQLYIAFYPTNVKYMALFTNGYERVVDDERGQKRRRDVWNQIRRGLLSDLKADGSSTATADVAEEKKFRLDSKKWVNFEAAKAALLSMPEDTYPNADVLFSSGPATVKASKSKRAKSAKKSDKIDTQAGKQMSKASADSRFALSKELDGMFVESTTGNDFQEKLDKEDRDNSSSSAPSSEDDSSSGDEADPLKDYDGKNHKVNANGASAATENNSSSSNSSSSDDSSSSSSDSSSDSDGEEPSQSSIAVKDDIVIRDIADDAGDDDSEDDFFASSTALSATDAFAKAQADQEKNRRRHGRDDSMSSYGRGGRPDKSAGFKSQNQSRREYRAYQQRSTRQKFG